MADTLSSGGSGATRVRSNRINRTILKIIPAGLNPAGFFIVQPNVHLLRVK